MIKGIELKNFKAFDELKIDLNNRNLLVYGDNGTGKSSLFEAIKVAYFKDKIIKEYKLKDKTPEDTKNKLREFFSKYNNSKNKNDYTLKLNSIECALDNESVKIGDNIFMIDYLINYLKNSELELINFLKEQYFTLDNIEDINFKNIESKVNNILKEFQEDKIKIELEQELEGIEEKKKKVWLKIIDNDRGLESRSIKTYFNEAKVNMIILIIVFETIKQNIKNGIIVLDDFITSLDIANRIFLIKYIFDSFKDWQLIVLTHNLEFFNLMKYIKDDKIVDFKNKWEFYEFYENKDKINYINNEEKDKLKIENIKKELDKNSSEKEYIANMIRKKFENMLHILSRNLLIGAIEESDSIVRTLLNDKNIYLRNISTDKKVKFNNANDILNEIDGKKDINEIQRILNETRISKEKLDKVRDTLREIKLYRKIILHPLSHNQAQFHIKELYATLYLIKELDDSINDLI